MIRVLTGVVAVVVAMLLPLSDGMAQTQTRVGKQTDWAIFEAGEGGQKVCWIATAPTKSVAKRGGKTVQVNRGDIFLMVAVRPADGAQNEVSFLSGYPFKNDSKVKASVGSQNFEMFTVGENAWMSSNAKDEEIVAAFRRGSDARIEGVSARGTTTLDTFSLRGFTAAFEQAKKLCS